MAQAGEGEQVYRSILHLVLCHPDELFHYNQVSFVSKQHLGEQNYYYHSLQTTSAATQPSTLLSWSFPTKQGCFHHWHEVHRQESVIFYHISHDNHVCRPI